MNTIRMEISALKHPEKNVRVHTEQQLKEFIRSLDLLGQIRPAVIDENAVILAGNGLVQAMRLRGDTHIEVWQITGLTEAKKKKLMLADNRLSSLSYDDLDIMKEFLAELGEDLDIPGYSADVLDDMLQKSNEAMAKIVNLQSGNKGSYVGFAPQVKIDAKEDDFDIDKALEETDKAISQRGDIWLLGRHRLMCGDSTVSVDVEKLMDGQSAHLLITDPPYNVDYGAGGNANHPTWKKRDGILNDNMSQSDFGEFLLNTFKNASKALLPGGMVYAFMSTQEWGNMMAAMQSSGFHWSSTIIWAKANGFVMSRKDYHTHYEPIWYGWLDNAKRIHPLTDRKQSDLWSVDRPKVSELHPTMKPIPLLSIAMNNSSGIGDVILDLFGGSGSTLITAEQLDRTSYSMELSEKYTDVIVRRYINAVGNSDGVFLFRDGKSIPHSELSEEAI